MRAPVVSGMRPPPTMAANAARGGSVSRAPDHPGAIPAPASAALPHSPNAHARSTWQTAGPASPGIEDLSSGQGSARSRYPGAAATVKAAPGGAQNMREVRSQLASSSSQAPLGGITPQSGAASAAATAASASVAVARPVALTGDVNAGGGSGSFAIAHGGAHTEVVRQISMPSVRHDQLQPGQAVHTTVQTAGAVAAAASPAPSPELPQPHGAASPQADGSSGGGATASRAVPTGRPPPQVVTFSARTPAVAGRLGQPYIFSSGKPAEGFPATAGQSPARTRPLTGPPPGPAGAQVTANRSPARVRPLPPQQQASPATQPAAVSSGMPAGYPAPRDNLAPAAVEAALERAAAIPVRRAADLVVIGAREEAADRESATLLNCPWADGIGPAPDDESTEIVPQKPRGQLTPEERIGYNEIQFVEHLGSGEFGQVFRGYHKGKEVAIKQLYWDNTVLPEVIIADLTREIESFRHLAHKRLVGFYGACLEIPNLCLITEYMPGGSLHHLLHHRRLKLPLLHCINMCLQLAEGVMYLHSQNPVVVHRDLKSLNVVLDLKFNIKLCDFGLTESMDRTHITKKNNGGSPRYMAPELFDSKSKITEKVDIWSMGCIFTEIFGGPLPYEGINTLADLTREMLVHRRIPMIPHDIPDNVQGIIRSCYNFDARLRPSAKAAFEQLRDAKKVLRAHGVLEA
eukprot:TRINITY_DN111472_c0_g1_i1.p1 TRINITY_DN111472_c0_g1~~TRINITY_DN111472_c0_g1_i1.p1  ORF type:complete len:810 (-),score=146.24 TRINITY_DN111472_c0_g1_i1:77-2146(-)